MHCTVCCVCWFLYSDHQEVLQPGRVSVPRCLRGTLLLQALWWDSALPAANWVLPVWTEHRLWSQTSRGSIASTLRDCCREQPQEHPSSPSPCHGACCHALRGLLCNEGANVCLCFYKCFPSHRRPQARLWWPQASGPLMQCQHHLSIHITSLPFLKVHAESMQLNAYH